MKKNRNLRIPENAPLTEPYQPTPFDNALARRRFQVGQAALTRAQLAQEAAAKAGPKAPTAEELRQAELQRLVAPIDRLSLGTVEYIRNRKGAPRFRVPIPKLQIHPSPMIADREYTRSPSRFTLPKHETAPAYPLFIQTCPAQTGPVGESRFQAYDRLRDAIYHGTYVSGFFLGTDAQIYAMDTVNVRNGSDNYITGDSAYPLSDEDKLKGPILLTDPEARRILQRPPETSIQDRYAQAPLLDPQVALEQWSDLMAEAVVATDRVTQMDIPDFH